MIFWVLNKKWVVNAGPYRGKFEVALRAFMIGLQLFFIFDLSISIAAQYTLSTLGLYINLSLQAHLCAIQAYLLKPYNVGIVLSVK
jgi:hypothetical protein